MYLPDQRAPQRQTEGRELRSQPASLSGPELAGTSVNLNDASFNSRPNFASYSEFNDRVKELVQAGGSASNRELALLMLDISRQESPLTELLSERREVAAYLVTSALLKNAGIGHVLLWQKISPAEKTTSAERVQIQAAVRAIARGNHGDLDVAKGARQAWFESVTINSPIKPLLEAALNIAARIHPQGEWGAVKLLFVLSDIPWMLTSRNKMIVYNSHRDSIDEIASQIGPRK